MTPKEKAKELFDKYSSYVAEKDFFGDNVEKSNAQLCALIAVDEILKDIGDYLGQVNPKRYYWIRVKEEINKL